MLIIDKGAQPIVVFSQPFCSETFCKYPFITLLAKWLLKQSKSRILPVTAENLQKLENSGDINLSLPITSTYLRQMRHKSEMPINDANDDQEDMEEDEVGKDYNIVL